MKQRFSVFNLEAVKEQIEPPFTPEGVLVDLAHGVVMRFRITRHHGDVYHGIVEGGKSAVMNIATGEFNVKG